MNLKILSVLFLLSIFNVSFAQKKINVFTIGDSTMADKKAEVFPETGWGQVFFQFFDDQVVVHNHAVNGRSSKSFISEGRWQAVLDSLQKGDYVFIQFGHNDQKINAPERYAEPFGSYTENLAKYISESRSKGAIPVLFTSIVRRKFNEKGKLTDTHGDYPVAVRELAKKMDVPLVDLQKSTQKVVQALGDEKSKKMYLWAEPDSRFPEGRKDDTHLCVDGARKVASLAATELKKLNLGLSQHVVEQRKVVGLDNWFNREYHKKTGKLYHYTWDDTENSGFSQLGDLFKEQGCVLKTIGERPLKAILGCLDVYIIVDPDTTTESKNPNYIDAESIHSIKNWVQNGGVLLLMANDGPNCEFTHFNQLAKTFGFRFIPSTLNPVLNRNWEMGAETDLPDHPLFRNVGKIYMKEVAPIKLSDNARPILTDNGHVYIAETPFGKGRILAIGDPWLYNEYIGHKLLPESFENMKAAENMVKYLLSGEGK
ncbi:MAG: GDSL-type esterase/lipase family protein [Prolixibacteraceae bacterium]|jgi:lysophospholipase L1-like esterase|nr:GDSL-type esterase/lipase family protein [Prolixibacteraceae bacterium]